MKVKLLGDIVEPRLMKQWFLDTVDVDREVYDDIKQGKVIFSDFTIL